MDVVCAPVGFMLHIFLGEASNVKVVIYIARGSLDSPIRD